MAERYLGRGVGVGLHPGQPTLKLRDLVLDRHRIESTTRLGLDTLHRSERGVVEVELLLVVTDQGLDRLVPGPVRSADLGLVLLGVRSSHHVVQSSVSFARLGCLLGPCAVLPVYLQTLQYRVNTD